MIEPDIVQEPMPAQEIQQKKAKELIKKLQ
jgi:hypothetical protein